MKSYIQPILLFLFTFVHGAPGVGQNTGRLAHYFNPKWSPDGKSILFESTMDGKSAIYTVSIDGTGLKKLTDTASDYGQPSWSLDGKFVVYYGKVHPMQLFINQANGSKQRELTIPSVDSYQPSWAVQNKIAFNSRPLGQTPNEISVVNADGTGFKRITDTLFDYAAPKWSPD